MTQQELYILESSIVKLVSRSTKGPGEAMAVLARISSALLGTTAALMEGSVEDNLAWVRDRFVDALDQCVGLVDLNKPEVQERVADIKVDVLLKDLNIPKSEP